MTPLKTGLLACALMAASATASLAQTLTATNAGALRSDGGSLYLGTPRNIYTGVASGESWRSFVSFSVPVSATNYTSATLNLGPTNDTGGPNTLEVFDASADPAATPVITAYNDIGTGVSLGSASISGGTVQVTLNASGLAAVNAAKGATLHLGLVNSTITLPSDNIFGGSQDSGPRQLVLSTATPVPTLSEWAMILLGAILAGGAALYIQRRQLDA